MLITAKHLLAIILLVIGWCGVCMFAASRLSENMFYVVVALSAFLVPALLGSPLFRLLSLRPLILPLCPHCGKCCGNYHVPRDAWPVAVIPCVHCGEALRLILITGTVSFPPSELPVLTLRRPGFLGLWRRMSIPAER